MGHCRQKAMWTMRISPSVSRILNFMKCHCDNQTLPTWSLYLHVKHNIPPEFNAGKWVNSYSYRHFVGGAVSARAQCMQNSYTWIVHLLLAAVLMHVHSMNGQNPRPWNIASVSAYILLLSLASIIVNRYRRSIEKSNCLKTGNMCLKL